MPKIILWSEQKKIVCNIFLLMKYASIRFRFWIKITYTSFSCSDLYNKKIQWNTMIIKIWWTYFKLVSNITLDTEKYILFQWIN